MDTTNKYNQVVILTGKGGTGNKTGAALLGIIPFHEDFVHSLQQGKTIVEYNPEIKKQIENVWSEIIVQTKTRIN
ncbi:MAG: hypothetical protein C0417_06955 [Chlorobiaceae bacterium]|nr:hypothetical protein [Chlorobiaceae bacterium]